MKQQCSHAPSVSFILKICAFSLRGFINFTNGKLVASNLAENDQSGCFGLGDVITVL